MRTRWPPQNWSKRADQEVDLGDWILLLLSMQLVEMEVAWVVKVAALCSGVAQLVQVDPRSLGQGYVATCSVI